MAVITINGAELHYDDITAIADDDSACDAPVIVWLHGFLFAAELFRPVIDEMPGYRHLALDLRGHGRSAGVTDDATLSRMADDTWELLTQIEVERFACVGHSLGAAVGARLVSRHPASVVAGISLAGIPIAGVPETLRAANAGLLDLRGDQSAMAAMLTGLFVHNQENDVIDACSRTAALVGEGPLRSVVTTELYLDDSAQILPGLTQPWLYLIPSEDLAIPPASQLASAQDVSGARVLWLNDEGHVFPQERPHETATWITAFLSTVST